MGAHVKKISQKAMQEAATLYVQDKWSLQAVGNMLGLSAVAAGVRLRKAGVAIRPTGTNGRTAAPVFAPARPYVSPTHCVCKKPVPSGQRYPWGEMCRGCEMPMQGNPPPASNAHAGCPCIDCHRAFGTVGGAVP